MINKEEILRLFPEKLICEVKTYLEKSQVEEIRVKTNRPIIISTIKEEVVLDYIATEDDLKFMMAKISNYSLYAFEEQIKQGYITLKGGHRVGLAGECVITNGDISTIKNITSLNIRVTREIIGVSNKIMSKIISNGRVLNTLIISPPKCGKTTLLRDIARNISNGMYRLDLKGKKVTIVDERSEIAGSFNGIPQLNVGIRSDILDNCLKKTGMLMAIRSLSPEVLVCDEIGTYGEMEALQVAFNSGVNIIVTVHGFDIEDIYSRRIFKELIEQSILQRIIVLSNKNGAGTVDKVYEVKRGGEMICLNM